MKKLTIIGFIVVFLCVGVVLWQHLKYSSDTQISHRLQGAWINGPQLSHGSVSFHPDGSYAIDSTFGTNELSTEGTWQVKDGFLIITTTNVLSGVGGRIGSVLKDKIVHVNDKELVFSSHGVTITWKRKQ